MKFKDIARIWLEARNKGADLDEWPDYPAYKLEAEDMQRAMNAIDPSDLYRQKMVSPESSAGYGTDAVFLGGDKSKMGIGPQIIMAASGSSRLPINTLPKGMEKGAYKHELGHATDYRLRDFAKNKGYLKRYGLTGPLISRELPAFEWRICNAIQKYEANEIYDGQSP